MKWNLGMIKFDLNVHDMSSKGIINDVLMMIQKEKKEEKEQKKIISSPAIANSFTYIYIHIHISLGYKTKHQSSFIPYIYTNNIYDLL